MLGERPGFPGSHREPSRATGVSLVLGWVLCRARGITGCSLYSPCLSRKVSPHTGLPGLGGTVSVNPSFLPPQCVLLTSVLHPRAVIPHLQSAFRRVFSCMDSCSI